MILHTAKSPSINSPESEGHFPCRSRCVPLIYSHAACSSLPPLLDQHRSDSNFWLPILSLLIYTLFYFLLLWFKSWYSSRWKDFFDGTSLPKFCVMEDTWKTHSWRDKSLGYNTLHVRLPCDRDIACLSTQQTPWPIHKILFEWLVTYPLL